MTDGPAPGQTASGKPGRTKYAPKACQECRRRRAKCDAAKPTCARCMSRQVACVYTTDNDGRGMAPKSYVRLLQARIAVLEKILRLHSIDVDAQLMLHGEPAVTTPRDSAVAVDQLCEAFEGTLSLDEAQNFDRDGEARYFGLTSGRLDFQTCDDVSGCAPSDYSLPLGPDVQSPGVSEELEAHLLEQYFTWEQPWLQVVDEALFRDSRSNNGRYYSPLLLNCILASGARFSDRVDVRSDPDDANTAGRGYLETAEALLQVDLTRPSITTIQSLAILGYAYHAFGQDVAGWLHGGMAYRLILDMGLNLDPGSLVASGRMTAEEGELRRQIYWSVYCMDKLAAAYTGRVCAVLEFQGSVTLPTVPAHAQESGPRRALYSVRPELLVAIQTGLIRLCQIHEKILVNLYAPKKLSLGDQRRNFFDCCLLWLKSWLYSLPTELKPVQSGILNRFPQAYTLSMVYHTAVILLVRPYMQTQTQANTGEPRHETLAEKASNILLEAARNISSLDDQYRQVFGSFRKSPITATHANLSAALALLHPRSGNGQRVQTDDAKMRSCIQTLKELSTAWTPPGKYHCSILKMMAAGRESETISEALGDCHDGSIDVGGGDGLVQPWPVASADDAGWPLWQPGDARCAGELAESIQLDLGFNTPWDDSDWNWLRTCLPGDYSCS